MAGRGIWEGFDMIAIIGASGAVGIPTIKHLVERGATVRALTSNQASAARLADLGVAETVIGDFRAEADVRRAVDGAEAVFLVTPRFTEDEAEIGLRAVEQARQAGVPRFVYSSAYHPQMRKMDHHWAKLLVEESVIESGMSFTILQPAMFMQNLRVEWQSIINKEIYLRPYSPDRKMALVDTDDLGAAAAIVLTEPGYAGACFELCGPDALTTADMAAILSEALGREIRAVQRDVDEWEAWARGRGWDDWSVQAYRKMCAHYDTHGYPGGNPLVLRTILGREPSGYRAFAETFVAEQRAAGAI
jgi:uncharacterized protein YbjT (DUF2867 family)